MANLARLAAPGSEDERLLRQLDLERLPRHVAVIMDGNGRWARKRRLPRIAGHRAGIASVRDLVEAAGGLEIQALTVYAFSKENWKRPKAEVRTLMALLKHYLRAELDTLLKNNIRFQVIGRALELPEDVRRELERGAESTRGCTGLLFNIALNYSGRAEITDAVRRLVADVLRNGRSHAPIDEATLASYLYTAGQPDPDLLIRTSGELRVSNFLLWQIAYSEIWVTDVLWPDFRRRHLLQAILDYQKRDRRYGGISSA